jgi:RNA polymerase sigma-70 factor (ECF subfamily)
MMPSNPASPEQTALVQSLFVQHLPALRGFVLSLVSDFSLVDDVVQETFLVVTAKAVSFERGTNFRAWAWTIARYKVLQMLEKNATAADRFAPEVLEALASHSEADSWFSEEQVQQLAKCMEELAPKAREAVELRYQQAHRPPEIATRLGWTVESVHVALSRARIFLRECVTHRMAAAAAGNI